MQLSLVDNGINPDRCFWVFKKPGIPYVLQPDAELWVKVFYGDEKSHGADCWYKNKMIINKNLYQE